MSNSNRPEVPSGTFALQVTPDLLLSLLNQDESPHPPRRTKKLKPKPKPQQQPLPPAPLPGPFFPGFHRNAHQPIPPLEDHVPNQKLEQPEDQLSHSHLPNKVENLESEFQKEAAHVSQLIEKTEKLGAELHKKEVAELQQIKDRAKDLLEKQYVAPVRPVPCSAEREACTQCYRENVTDPLRCKRAVEAFVECARRAQQSFLV